MSERTVRAELRRRLGVERGIEVHETTLVSWAVAFHFATLGVVFLPVVSTLTPLRVAFVFVNLTFVPGLLFLIALNEFDLSIDRLLYTVGSSLILVMAMGVTINLVLPAVGFADPLSAPYLSLGTTVLVGGLAALAYYRANARTETLELPRVVEGAVSPVVPFSLLLLPTTIISIIVLQGYSQNLPIIVVLSVIAVVPLILLFTSQTKWYPLGIWGAAVALLYHSTLSSQAYGGSSIPMHIMQADRWTPGIGEVASTTTPLVANGILYPTYATLTGIPYYIQTSFVNPLLVSLLPVILFQMYRRYVSDAVALLGVSVFIFSHPFYRLYPGGGRVATPVLFLAFVGLLVADTDLGARNKKLLSLMFASGIVVSHYGTSYYAMLALFGAYALLWVLPTVESLLERVSSRSHAAASDVVQFSENRDGFPILTASFVGFFGVLVLAWYIYTGGGGYFSLPRHIYHSALALFEGNFLSSSTANRVQKSYGYGTTSIRVARFIYIGLICLMSLGVATELVKRLSPSRETRFQDEYLAISSMLLAFAGSAFLLPVGWGGGRPMMIAFTFIGVFAPLGLLAVGRWLQTGVNELLSHVGSRTWRTSVNPFARVTLAVILALFLVLNTGVAAATVVGGSAPMNVPLQTEMDDQQNPNFRAQAYVDTDVQTHAWLLDHRSEEYGIRGDLIANAQTDKYRSSIALAMEEDVVFPYSTGKPQGLLNQLGESNRTEYVLILGHNLHLNVYTVNSTYERRPLTPLKDELEDRSQIYTTGESVIYYGRCATATRSTE